MMNVSQKTQFEKLFKEKMFYEIPNPIYRGWLGFMIATLCSEENVFDSILAAKTIIKYPWSQGQRREGLMVQLELSSWTFPARTTLLCSSPEKKKRKQRKKKQKEKQRKESRFKRRAGNKK